MDVFRNRMVDLGAVFPDRRMTFLDLLIYSLACFRLSLMVSKEDGPYWLFAKLRRLPPTKSSTRQGINCIYCVSVYAAGLVVTCYLFRGRFAFIEPWFIWPLAVSAVAICTHQTFTKGAL